MTRIALASTASLISLPLLVPVGICLTPMFPLLDCMISTPLGGHDGPSTFSLGLVGVACIAVFGAATRNANAGAMSTVDSLLRASLSALTRTRRTAARRRKLRLAQTAAARRPVFGREGQLQVWTDALIGIVFQAGMFKAMFFVFAGCERLAALAAHVTSSTASSRHSSGVAIARSSGVVITRPVHADSAA